VYPLPRRLTIGIRSAFGRENEYDNEAVVTCVWTLLSHIVFVCGYELDHVARRLTEAVHGIRQKRFPSYASILCRYSFHNGTAFLQVVVYVTCQCRTMPRLCVHTPRCVVVWLICWIVLLQCCGRGKLVRLPRCTGSVGCMSELSCHYSTWLHFHNWYLACGDIMQACIVVCVCTYVRMWPACV